ncbi:MAG TPA: methylamine utilization protein, partial [Dietzia sp.]|nr:methylamine utilization protein [Dietzia sp.]
GIAKRVGVAAASLAVGVGAAVAVGAVTGLTAPVALTVGVVGAAALTAVAANRSTCGMSVAGVVAAPKQADRPGDGSALGRLGAHLAGSLLTALPVGAGLGLVGMAVQSVVGPVPVAPLLAGWSSLAFLYGLHETGLLRMPTPMRRQQLPRHLRRVGRPMRVSFYFGTLIGPGFMIFIRSSAYYLLFLGAIALANPVLGAALFAVVSLGRCGPSALAIAHQRQGGTMGDFLLTCMAADRMVQLAAGSGLVALAGFGAAALAM